MEEILKAITTLCIKVDSMDNEIQKLKINEDNLKSKDSQQHDYKNAELRRSEDEKNPKLKGDDGKLLKTHNICLNIAAGTSKQVLSLELREAKVQYFNNPCQGSISVKEYALKFTQLSKYAPMMMSNSRAKMNKSVMGISDLVVKECCMDMLVNDMDIARLMTAAQQIEEEKL
ncbi:hypothetical protein MTR67_023113 [Solanum verrucosum]|uniref:Retrotransposon gag domain-containing protein n=1 Tax=Solanum verrucosum TaxID=315347 RepID=A0AAF0QUR1_SOLVR|nr:hypothetical protein MTR67_023113 [Solanum verrucosum]